MSEHNDTLENWDEVRMAYHVARLGTLSAASKYLGVHHATIIRHIDALESRLQCKLFHRHPRGYKPTEAGQDLMKIAAATEDQFAQLAGRLRGRSETVSGELVITTLSGLSSQFTPMLAEFQRMHPALRIKLVADERPLKLEYGEAHVALRAGQKPQQPDNVVQPLFTLKMALFAHKSYVETHGPLRGLDDIKNHKFVFNPAESVRAPFGKWVEQYLPPENIVFSATQLRNLSDAIYAGAGIGFLPVWAGLGTDELVEMMPSDPEWNSPIWIVTHVDLHRTAKVHAFVKFIKERFATCYE